MGKGAATPAMQALPQPPAEKTVEEKVQESLKDMKNKKGRRSTILTSALGDTLSATLGKKTLLGQ